MITVTEKRRRKRKREKLCATLVTGMMEIIDKSGMLIYVTSVWIKTMYSDPNTKKAHLEDFIKVLERVEKEADVSQYRLDAIRRCIERCKED